MRKLMLLAATLVAACAPKRAAEVDPVVAAGKATADSVRGEKFAAAVGGPATGMRPVPASVNIRFDPDAARAGVAGSAIVAFVVQPNGRVDRESRTLVYVEGHQIYAKNICDALNEMRFDPPPTNAGGAISTFPVFFSIQGAGKRDSAQAVFGRTLQILNAKLAAMTPEEAKSWFRARPTCSAIRIGVNPLYGPPASY
jgi:hypothetical protein